MKRNFITLLTMGFVLMGSIDARAEGILGDMNIFMRNRQPALTSLVSTSGPQIPPEKQIVVVGVVRDLASGEFRATVENTAHHEISILKVGDTIAGGQITAISLNPASGIEYRKSGTNQSVWVPLGSTLADARPTTRPGVRP